jgi:hypothetical protein
MIAVTLHGADVWPYYALAAATGVATATGCPVSFRRADRAPAEPAPRAGR